MSIVLVMVMITFRIMTMIKTIVVYFFIKHWQLTAFPVMLNINVPPLSAGYRPHVALAVVRPPVTTTYRQASRGATLHCQALAPGHSEVKVTHAIIHTVRCGTRQHDQP